MASFPFMSVQETEHGFRRICSEMEDAHNLHHFIVDAGEVMSGSVVRSQLDNAQRFNVHRWSDYPEVKAATDSIFAEFESLPDFRGMSNITKRHIRVVLL